MVATLTWTPYVSIHWAQCSASVASGVAATWASSAAAWSGPIKGVRPGRGFGARAPVVACWVRHRVIERKLTPKVRAASAWL
jgi:hypothetical protein